MNCPSCGNRLYVQGNTFERHGSRVVGAFCQLESCLSYSKPFYINLTKGVEMKAILSYVKVELYHVVNGEKRFGPHENISGDVSGLSGNVSGLRGNVSGLSGNVDGLRGNVSGLSGNVDGLSGNVDGLSGNVDKCDITINDRKKTINIVDLIAKK